MTNDHGGREVSRPEREQRITQETVVGSRKLGQAPRHSSFSLSCVWPSPYPGGMSRDLSGLHMGPK